MRVLLYSRQFFPDIGGLETVSMTLARGIAAAGHECVVLTEAARSKSDDPGFPFSVLRAPSRRARLEAVRSADVVHSNGASLQLLPYAKLAGKPFIWTHQGYQLMAIDGLGWVDGEPAPLTPLASVGYHLRKQGLRRGAIAAFKLAVRRAAARAVDRHVAITQWVADRQPLPGQTVIHNPFPISRFRQPAKAEAPDFDFVFVGRLVSEKGVRTLLRALAELNGEARRPPATLLIVGDGDRRAELETLAATLHLGAAVHFGGAQQGPALIEAVARGRIAVVPSEWEEPMGGVALELMAAGKPLIVSQQGGLSECAGDAAITFRNGDVSDLAARMRELLDDEPLRARLRAAGSRRIALFDERELIARYLGLYEDVRARRHRRDRPSAW